MLRLFNKTLIPQNNYVSLQQLREDLEFTASGNVDTAMQKTSELVYKFKSLSFICKNFHLFSYSHLNIIRTFYFDICHMPHLKVSQRI
jgi:hypothetical protein